MQKQKKRNIPVGFLGDFFDHVYNKGTLPVDILNSLLRYFEQEWSVPMIMIPGNHDYFDASETEHGLTPFKYASKFITVIDTPTKIGNQLWVPWRRSTDDIEAAIASNNGVDVIFGHFDIVGFKVNATHKSTHGVSPDIFPRNIPVYSGHYHTPQKHSNICYLGSPYQLTLAEAEDKKALLILEQNVWNVCESIPIEVGRRQYKWTPDELVTRKNELKEEDRVSVTVADDHNIQYVIDSLLDRGVTVDVKRAPAPVVTRMEETCHKTPMHLLEAYSKRHSVDTSKRSWMFMKDWIKKWSQMRPFLVKDIRPVRIRIQNFGPFPGPLTLALQGQGFTLVSGETHNMSNASNGVGKSMITAGAWLWVCTGSIDQRGSLAFDEDTGIVHSEMDTASVCVEGCIGTSTWSIQRTLSSGRKRKHTLRYFVNDIERTRSTLSGTQRAICSELFGLDVTGSALYEWLVQNCVWSQQSATRWIDASETQAKTQIQPLANMDIWCTMHSQAKKKQKETDANISTCKTNLDNLLRSREDAKKRFDIAVKNANIWQKQHDLQVRDSNHDLKGTQIKLEAALESCGEKVTLTKGNKEKLLSLRDQLQEQRDKMTRLNVQMNKLKEDLDISWLHSDFEDVKSRAYEKELPNTKKTKLRREHCVAAWHARKAILEDKKKKIQARMKREDACPMCKRPFDKSNDYEEHMLTLSTEIKNAQANMTSASQDLKKAEDAHERAEREKEETLKLRKNIENTIEMKKYLTQHCIVSKQCQTLEEKIYDLNEEIKIEETQMRAYEQTYQVCEDLRSTIDILRRNHELLLSRVCPYRPDQTEIESIQKKINLVEYELIQHHADQSMWREALTLSGPRGIQTYAMEYTIQKLASATSMWLQKLFHSKDIHLRAYFDEKERLHRHVESKEHSGIMSGGQWRRVQLASFLAWRDMSGHVFPLLIMDEPCTSMDKMGIQDVQQTLRDWCDADTDRTCFFITHEPGQHRDTSIYHSHTKILHKRGRSSIIDGSSRKRRK